MQPVGLVELGVGRHAGQEKGIKDDRVTRRKRGVDGVEFARVVGTQVAHGLHPGQENGNVARGEPVEDLIERGLGDLGIDAAQHVVGAQLDDHCVGARGHGPVEPRETAACGVARYPGIRDVDSDALCRKCTRELGGEGLIRRQAETGGERIAQGDDLHRPLGGLRGTSEANQRQHQRRQALYRTVPVPI